jgi:hypothetical protein
MTEYLIAFNNEWVPEHTDEELCGWSQEVRRSGPHATSGDSLTESTGRRSRYRSAVTTGTPSSKATVMVPCWSVLQTWAPGASMAARVDGTGWP